MQYKLDLWSKYGFNLKWLLLPQLPLDRHLNTKNANSIFKIKVYITCDKGCVMATGMPNPISFYYTSNESLFTYFL